MQPIGPQRADLHAGIIASTIANVNRVPDKKPEAWEPEDFIPWMQEEREVLKKERVVTKVRNVLSGFIGKDK